MECRELFRSGAITTTVDKFANGLVNSGWHERRVNPKLKSARSETSRAYTWSVYPGNDRFAFSGSYPPFDVEGKRGRACERPTMRMYQVSRYSCFERNLSNQFADDWEARFLISILVAWLNRRALIITTYESDRKTIHSFFDRLL